MQFVELAAKFASKITVLNGTQSADGRNPMDLLMLVATKGTRLTLVVDGPDAAGAMDALAGMVDSGFGET